MRKRWSRQIGVQTLADQARKSGNRRLNRKEQESIFGRKRNLPQAQLTDRKSRHHRTREKVHDSLVEGSLDGVPGIVVIR